MKRLLYILPFFSLWVSASELECAVLTSPLANSTDAPTSTSIRWTSQPEAIGYEVTVGTSQFENDILEQTIYTETLTEEFILPPNTTIYVIIIPFSNSQFAVGCEYLMFTTSDCSYFVNPVSEMSLCFSGGTGNVSNADTELVKTNLIGQQENLGISYFDMEGNSIALETIETSEEINQYVILARIVDELNCMKEIEFILFLDERSEATSLDDVLVCKSYVLPELNHGDSYYAENQETLSAGTVIMESQTIRVRAENGPCLDEKSFTITIDSDVCNTLVAGTDYPNYFTPNGDGINDFWNLRSSVDINILSILIHDRFGNLISQFSTSDTGWDGTFNGSPLPASDYWFVLQTANRPITGHFALKR